MNKTNRASRLYLVKGLVIGFVAVSALLFLRTLSTGSAKDKTSTDQPKYSDVSNAKRDSTSLDDLAKRINALIEESQFAYARWGVSVISASDGTTIYQRNAGNLFTPASNMKIYTTGVALDVLGADYRWRTSVYANGQPDANGTVSGDLILYGRGAPDLVSASRDEHAGSLGKLAGDLYARGIRKVTGNVIGDESYFRGNAWGDGWQWTDMQWYFGAEASALSINGNEIDLNVIPSSTRKEQPTIRISDNQGYVTVQNQLVTADLGVRPTIGVHRGLSDNSVQVWGEFAPGSKGFGARLSVHRPALWAAKLFLDVLKTRGIAVEGQSVVRDSRMPASQRFQPSQAVELAYVTSEPLGEITKRTNKESVNLNAELTLRTLGRERGQSAIHAEPVGRELGDDEAGLAVIKFWMARAGISTEHIALHDGSGLSRLDLVTPESTTRLLVALSKTPAYQAFRQSLPISGKDGTLAGRLKSLVDRVEAKTGSLTYDNSLSGYLTNAKGETFAFSVMCNDQTGRANSIQLIDKIVALVAAFPDLPSKTSGQTP
ncbi:MAG: D-alanyl-D-alanine carboxypeptidase/D-alanyl-D-alanine-endopeptidase [Pyrinomonadaceae bacterium]